MELAETDTHPLYRAHAATHSRCIVCGECASGSLGLRFSLGPDHSVEAQFACPSRLQGYDNILHGGVISTLLDSAMTHCLFANGIVGLTAELKVRFRHPVDVGIPVTVRACMTRSQPPLYLLESRIIQDGIVKATAVGKFMREPLQRETPAPVRSMSQPAPDA